VVSLQGWMVASWLCWQASGVLLHLLFTQHKADAVAHVPHSWGSRSAAQCLMCVFGWVEGSCAVGQGVFG
jgi:hypothetical protein